MCENVENFFSRLDPSSFWRLKFPLYSDFSKFILQFFLYYFIERWILNGKNSGNSNILSSYLNIPLNENENKSSIFKATVVCNKIFLIFLHAFLNFYNLPEKCFPKKNWRPSKVEASLFKMKPSGSLDNFFFTKLCQFKLSTIFYRHWRSYSLHCITYTIFTAPFVFILDCHDSLSIFLQLFPLSSLSWHFLSLFFFRPCSFFERQPREFTRTTH